MPLDSQLLVGLFDLCLGSSLFEAEHFVVIALLRHKNVIKLYSSVLKQHRSILKRTVNSAVYHLSLKSAQTAPCSLLITKALVGMAYAR